MADFATDLTAGHAVAVMRAIAVTITTTIITTTTIIASTIITGNADADADVDFSFGLLNRLESNDTGKKCGSNNN